MKKSTAKVLIIVSIILLHEAGQTKGFAAGPGGGCMQRMHRGSLGGNAVRNKPAKGNHLEVSVGQRKRNGDHWNVKYTKNPEDHNINVEAGSQKPNGDHWSVNYIHDIEGKP